MPLSMTGYGAASAESADRRFEVELRSVNHRYCDVRTHLPSELAALSKPLEDYVRKQVTRGRVDVSVQIELRSTEALRPHVDLDRARMYFEACREVADALELPLTIGAEQVLEASGAIRMTTPPPDLDGAKEALFAAAGDALVALLAMRRAEGAALENDLASHLDGVKALASAIGRDLHRAVADRKRKLEQRIDELLGSEHALDSNRLAQEVAMIADRVDVTEELERLQSHCDQFKGLLSKESSVGRKLDFLIQEMNREANTIGSKCADAAIAHLVVDLKAELERMREQVQNVE